MKHPSGVFHKGTAGRPLVVFIHGMGLDERIWVRPAEARVLGGKYPATVLLKGVDTDMKTLFDLCKERGFPVLTWSQGRPVGPIAVAVEELQELLRRYGPAAAGGVILVGHSRGGLVARKYLETCAGPVRGLITLATPHCGSSIAKWADYIGPLAAVVRRLTGGGEDKETRTVFQRILGFLCSTGIREHYPGSSFLAELKDERREGVTYVSLGGTNPHLVRFGPFSPADLMKKSMPDTLIPPELKEGCGDGMVSAASAKLPYGDRHRDFPVTHIGILFDRAVQKYVMDVVEEMG